MKKLLLILGLFFTVLSVYAANDYSSRFISSFSACEPFMETSTILDASGAKVQITKIVQGVKNHDCIYKQIILRPTVKDVTVCAFTKPMAMEIADAMKAENGEKFNVNIDIKGEIIPLIGVTKSQIVWTQYLNADTVCKREILER